MSGEAMIPSDRWCKYKEGACIFLDKGMPWCNLFQTDIFSPDENNCGERADICCIVYPGGAVVNIAVKEAHNDQD